MSASISTWALTEDLGGSVGDDPFERAIAAGRSGDKSAIDELYAIWRGARDDESIAFRRWCVARDGAGYAVYRAAADRADAAQEMLATYCRAWAASP